MQVAELKAEAARTAEHQRQQAQAIADSEACATKLQAKLADKATALHSAQARIAELDQERSDAAALAAAIYQELVDVKVFTCSECLSDQKASAWETSRTDALTVVPPTRRRSWTWRTAMPATQSAGTRT